LGLNVKGLGFEVKEGVNRIVFLRRLTFPKSVSDCLPLRFFCRDVRATLSLLVA